jgi:hypothetical protein
VVQYYNIQLSTLVNDHLDAELLDPDPLATPRKARKLDLHIEDVAALALYLRALDGEPALEAAKQ